MQTSLNASELKSKTVPFLKKLLKEEGVPYKEYSVMKKAEIITMLSKPEDKTIPNTSEGLEKDVEEFVKNGGVITEGPAVGTPRQKPSKETQALMSPTKLRRRKKKNKIEAAQGSEDTVVASPKRKKKDFRIKEVTLKSICEKHRVKGTLVRKALRTSDIQKPGKQWVWEEGHSDIQTVTDLVISLK